MTGNRYKDWTQQELKSVERFNKYMKRMTEESEKIFDELKSYKLPERIRPWIRALDDEDKRATHAFPRSTKQSRDVKRTFHLADHVWIYEGLKSVEYLQLKEELMLSDSERDRVNSRKGSEHESGKQNEASRGSHFSSVEFRRNFRKRFATENPISKQIMLATSRTSSGTRFLFHSKDTVLFYWDSELFDQVEEGSKKSTSTSKKRDDSWRRKIDAWRNTMDCQAKHEENQSLDWEKPLWYALALMAGSRRRKLNALSPDELVSTTSNILLGISSPNGLFPGRIDEDREPVSFEDELERDDYWRATFEMPYILCKFGGQHLEESIQEDNKEGAPKRVDNTGSAKQQSLAEPVTGTTGQTGGVRISQLMRKRMLFAGFKNSIDQKVIVDLKDDWLLQGPDSVDFEFSPEKLIADYRKGKQARIRSINENEIDETRSVITTAMKAHRFRRSFSDQEGLKGSVVDIPKGPLGKNKDLSKVTPKQNHYILKVLAQKRTVHEARKRLIWLRNGDADTSLICYYASPRAERENLSSFFDRHASYDKYFIESTTAALNEWETELRLSFFRIGTVKDNLGGIPNPTFITLREPLQKNTEKTEITRAVMSFRFVGDLFDRYWTCHFLEYNCGTEEKANLKSRLTKLDQIQPKDEARNHPWQQRRVLELLLFNEVLEEMVLRTKHLLEWAQAQVLRPLELRKDKPKHDHVPDLEKASHDHGEHHLDISRLPENQICHESQGQTGESEATAETRPGTPNAVEPPGSTEGQPQPQKSRKSSNASTYPQTSVLFDRPFKVKVHNLQDNPLAKLLKGSSEFLLQGSSEGYFTINERWRIMEQVLQAVEEDLSENVERIHDWMRREKDRESEKPRWTRKDEKKYRSSMTKLQVLTQRKIREVERLQSRIRGFRDSLSGKLASIREDINFRGSENINLFTYVTVVFLPLGFATGIFSMNGPPEGKTLVPMVMTAAATVFITIVALINAKTLDTKTMEPVTAPIFRTLRGVGNLMLYFVLPALYLLLLILSPLILIAYVSVYYFHRYIVMPISQPRLKFIIGLRDEYVSQIKRYDPVQEVKFGYLDISRRSTSPEENMAGSGQSQNQTGFTDSGASTQRMRRLDIESRGYTPDV